MTTAADVVAEVRTWMRTPYAHEACIKGVGSDCAMLLVGVFAAVGVVPADFDPRPYPSNWMVHRSEERFLGWIADFADQLEEPARPCAADVVVWRFGRCFSHAAIVLDAVGNIAHAYQPAGMVTLGTLAEFAHRDRKVWRVRGVSA